MAFARTCKTTLYAGMLALALAPAASPTCAAHAPTPPAGAPGSRIYGDVLHRAGCSGRISFANRNSASSRAAQRHRAVARRDNCLRNFGIVIGNWSPPCVGHVYTTAAGGWVVCMTERERLLCLLLLWSIGVDDDTSLWVTIAPQIICGSQLLPKSDVTQKRCDMFSWARRAIPISQASRHSASHGLGARRKVLHSRTIAEELRGDVHVRATTGLCEVGVRRMKVLREKVHCRSSSSIHIDYNQPLVGGLSVHSTPARQIAKFQLPGGSTYKNRRSG